MSDQDTAVEEVPPEEEPALIHGAPASLWPGPSGPSERGTQRQLVVHPDRSSYLDVVRALREDGYQMCVDVTAVDYLASFQRPLPAGVRAERFEVVVNLLSFLEGRRIRVRVQVPDSDPTLPSLFELYPGTEAMERETFDMFGIVFEGHPDLTRILMPDDWEGHPLRKDYGVGRIPVQFKGAPQPR